MGKLSDYVDIEDGEYHLRDHTGEHGVYSAVPFHIEGQLIWYPPDEVETATKHETWDRILVGVAGEKEELRAEVYLNQLDRDELAIMRFSGPGRSVGVVSNLEAAEDVVKEMLVSTEWRIVEMHPWLGELIADAIYGGLEMD